MDNLINQDDDEMDRLSLSITDMITCYRFCLLLPNYIGVILTDSLVVVQLLCCCYCYIMVHARAFCRFREVFM